MMSSEKKDPNCYLSGLMFPALACFIAAQVFFSASCGKEKEDSKEEMRRPAKTLVVQSTDESLVLSLPGKVRASRRIDLAFKVSGPLIALPVREGQRVKQGDILAQIDSRDFETDQAKIKSTISQARSRLKAMEAGARPEDLKMLESEVAAAKASFQEAELQYERYNTLYKDNNVSKSEFDRFKARWEVARARLNTALQNLEKGKKGARTEDVEAMRAQIRGLEAEERETQYSLDDTILKAPFSGVIAKKYVENFQDVPAKQPIVSLQDISRLEIIVNVPEVFMVQIKEGEMDAAAEFSAAPGKQYPLTSKEFSTEADPNTQTYRAVLEMPAPEGMEILPGMTATVRGTLRCSGSVKDSEFLVPICIIPGQTSIFQVPVNAVFAGEEEKSHVWVVDQNTMRVRKREVEVGGIQGQEIRILKGLEAGDKIVTAGVNYLQEGQKIRDLKGKTGD